MLKDILRIYIPYRIDYQEINFNKEIHKSD